MDISNVFTTQNNHTMSQNKDYRHIPWIQHSESERIQDIALVCMFARVQKGMLQILYRKHIIF